MSRYSRQEIFPEIGKEGQEKLQNASVVIVGCGALGSLQAEVLTRAGIGRLKIIDRDFVEQVNLQRQALFTEKDAGQSIPKAVAAAAHLADINSDVQVDPIVADLNADNATLLSGASLILDGTDNFQTRYLINDISWKTGVPWIYGACVGASGIACAFIPPEFPCLRCVFDAEPPPGSAPTCDTAGILWPAVGAVVSYQVAAALKLLTGHPFLPQLLQLDVWENHYHVVSLAKAKRPGCLTCDTAEYPALQQRSDFETALCGRDAVQIKPQKRSQLDLEEVHRRWEKIGISFLNPFLVKLVLEENEIVLFSDGRAMIKGTADFVRARDLYARYVGI